FCLLRARKHGTRRSSAWPADPSALPTPSRLKPTFLAHHVCLIEIFVGLRQRNDALDQPGDVHDEIANAASQNTDEQHDDSRSCGANDEFVNSEATQENPAQSRRELCARC